MMKKKIINILKYILIGCFIICFFPILVKADNPYYSYTANNCFDTFSVLYSSGVSAGQYAVEKFKSNTDCRIVVLYDENGMYLYYVPSDYNQNVSTRKYRRSNSNQINIQACNISEPNTTFSNIHILNNNDTFYAVRLSVNGYPTNVTLEDALSGLNVPAYPIDTDNFSLKGGYPNEQALAYTYGGVVPEPSPEPINWGLVRDPEYSTRIAGNGYAAKRNIDYLSWNNEVDSNGNDISECSINIKAVLGSWSGTTTEDLLNKTYNDFNIGSYSSIDLGSVPANSGMFSVSWQRIIDEAGWNFDSLYSHFEDNIFLKQGWYYQLQLVDPDGGTHQWQTLYTPLSSSAAASETVINHNSFDTSIYQVYQDLATINNNTSITINIQDTDYTVTNPDDGDEPSGGVDLWDILKQMLNGIFQIVKNIAALPGKFLEMIQQLITPPQQISEEINTNFNNNMQDLNESQPGLMESMNAVEDIQDTLNQSVNSFNGVPECIFTWDAVTMDLSAFNAGNVTFIAAGSFDFAASFMQMINGFGMTYSEYQFYVSAIIYAWILVFIYRHVYDFLAGTKES